MMLIPATRAKSTAQIPVRTTTMKINGRPKRRTVACYPPSRFFYLSFSCITFLLRIYKSADFFFEGVRWAFETFLPVITAGRLRSQSLTPMLYVPCDENVLENARERGQQRRQNERDARERVRERSRGERTKRREKKYWNSTKAYTERTD